MHIFPGARSVCLFVKWIARSRGIYFSDGETRIAQCQASWIKNWLVSFYDRTCPTLIRDAATASNWFTRCSVTRNRLFIFTQRALDIVESSCVALNSDKETRHVHSFGIECVRWSTRRTKFVSCNYDSDHEVGYPYPGLRYGVDIDDWH